MGIKFIKDGVEQDLNPAAPKGQYHIPEEPKKEETDMMWKVMEENSQLKMKVMMLEGKLNAIKSLLGE